MDSIETIYWIHSITFVLLAGIIAVMVRAAYNCCQCAKRGRDKEMRLFQDPKFMRMTMIAFIGSVMLFAANCIFELLALTDDSLAFMSPVIEVFIAVTLLLLAHQFYISIACAKDWKKKGDIFAKKK